MPLKMWHFFVCVDWTENSRLKKVTQIDTIIHIWMTIHNIEMNVRVQDGTQKSVCECMFVQRWKLIVSKAVNWTIYYSLNCVNWN